MAAYYTRAKARSEVEPEDVEQGDSASVATTTPTPIVSVGLQGVSMRESGSMSTEVAGPVTTHPAFVALANLRCINALNNNNNNNNYCQREAIPPWVDAVIQGLLTLSKWGLTPWTSRPA